MASRSLILAVSLILALQPQSGMAAIDFEEQVKPILEKHCLQCHREDKDKGKYEMHTKELAFKGGSSEGRGVVPGDPENSSLYWTTTLPDDDELLMPPEKDGGPLAKNETEILKEWIAEGAEWPEDVTLELNRRVDFKSEIKPILDSLPSEQFELLKRWVEEGAEWPSDNPDNLELVREIHANIIATPQDEGAMEPYIDKIPGVSRGLEMVPVPGGQFEMALAGDVRHPVELQPFWMAKFETTWDFYEPFQVTTDLRNKDGSKKYPGEEDANVDIVSRPTKPYVEMSFGMGKNGYPAISMTQHAANKFCQWLSEQTGHFYRLPTEAEWEYACRAGSSTRYSFGDDSNELPTYGWYFDNANFKYQKVGLKKPNAWDLHDMHGNVAEWVLDGYSPEGSLAGVPLPGGEVGGEALQNPLAFPEALFPRCIRGGSWNDFPEDVTSSSRFGSSQTWKLQDPQFPQSIWYHTEALWLGFRVVRPREIPSAEEMHRIWNAATDAE